MILVDTNVWINHFRETDAELVANLNTGSVACHPFILKPAFYSWVEKETWRYDGGRIYANPQGSSG